MKKLKIFLTVFFCIITELVFSQQQDSIRRLPPLQTPRKSSIDIKHIVLNLGFDWNKKQAFGSATLTFSLLFPTDSISLDAESLTINSIELNNQKLNFSICENTENDKLKIYLGKKLPVKQEFKIKIDYHTNWINEIDPLSLSGSTGKGLRFSKPTSNDPNKPKEIWSVGEPNLNRFWFPSHDSPDDLRTTELIATVEKDLMVISNGNLVSKKENSDGTHTFHWKTEIPYANHLTNFVVCRYTNFMQHYGGVALNNYGYPHEAADTEASVERLPDMMRFYSEKIGVKYPYRSYNQAFVQGLPWGIVGNGLSAQSENMVDDFGTHADYLYLWDVLEGESLAAQWFGNMLTPKDWSHYWLSKGFQHYFSGLYDSYKNGHDEFLLWLHLPDQNTYLSDWDAGNRHPIVTKYYENELSFTNENYPNSRGANILHLLKKHLGDEKWWKVINYYVKNNAFKTVETDDFKKAVEVVLGERFDWFFDQWIYKMGHPIFEINKSFDENSKHLVLIVKQLQKKDTKEVFPQVEFFQGKIEVEIDDKIETIWLKPQAENSYSFTFPRNPKFVNFDFQSTWIKEIKFEKTLDELISQLEKSKDVLAKRESLTQLSAIYKNEKTSTETQAKIIESFRKLALSDSYWRIRLNALSSLQNLLAPFTKKEAAMLDEATTQMLLSIIKNEKSWLKASAIGFLGMTREEKYVELYLENLKDPSDRVISQSAAALGKTKSSFAFDALEKLMEKPSMKSQSRLSALAGLQELADPRGREIAYQALSNLNLLRWRLPDFSVWDYRVFAVRLIKSLGETDKTYTLLKERFDKSVVENDLEGVFNNTLLICTLGNEKGKEIFEILKQKYPKDSKILEAIEQYQNQFNQSVKK